MFEIETIERLQYAVRDGQPLTGTLYRPVAVQRCPVVIAVHGGGWKTGSPERYRFWGAWLARHGIGLFAISYRLCDRPTHLFPAPACDVIAACRFVHSSSEELRLDGGRIGLMGDSAGAHLASFAALADDSPLLAAELKEADGLKISAVVGVYGVYDLLGQWEHDQWARPRDQITEQLLGYSPLDDKIGYFAASPIAYTRVGGRRTPFLIVWGTEDDIVDCRMQSVRFVTALKQTGTYVRTVPVIGAPHFWIDQPIEEHESFTGFVAPRVLAFLKSFL